MIWTFIQARTGSKRFPRKVLQPFGDGLLIDAVHERAVQLGPPVAWLIPEGDEELARKCIGRGWVYLEGDEHDVLSRYANAAVRLKAEHVVRVTADCPFLDVEAGRWTIQAHLDSKADFTEYRAEGRAVEVFTAALLKELDELLWRNDEGFGNSRYREHIDDYLHIIQPCKWKKHNVKFSVDTPEELELARSRLGNTERICY